MSFWVQSAATYLVIFIMIVLWTLMIRVRSVVLFTFLCPILWSMKVINWLFDTNTASLYVDNNIKLFYNKSYSKFSRDTTRWIILYIESPNVTPPSKSNRLGAPWRIHHTLRHCARLHIYWWIFKSNIPKDSWFQQLSFEVSILSRNTMA